MWSLQKTIFFFFPLIFLYIWLACKPLKQFSQNLLFCGSSIWNLNPTNTPRRKTNTLDIFGFKFYYSSFLEDSNSVPSECGILHSYNFIQSFKYSVFHSTIRRHGTIFTCDCKWFTCDFPDSRSFILIIYVSFQKIKQLCYFNIFISHINALWTLIVLRHS